MLLTLIKHSGEASEVAAMAAFALCPNVRSKEVVSFCPRSAVYALEFPAAQKGIFGGGGGGVGLGNSVSDYSQAQDSASLRSKFTNHSTPCVRHFVSPM